MIGTSPPAPSAEDLARFRADLDPDDELVPRVLAAADPVRVLRALERIAEATGRPGPLGRRLRASPLLGAALVGIADNSRFLVDHLRRHPADLSELEDPLALAHPLDPARLDPPTESGALRQWKRRQLLHIVARDALGLSDLATVGEELAVLADACLRAAVVIAGGEGAAFAVVAMGKLGAEELNYSSDVDVLFVHEGDGEEARRIAQGVIKAIGEVTGDGEVFRIDTGLRPEGRSGPLSRTVDSYRAYWERWAETWEFQALLKARPAAGDTGLGQGLLDAAEPFVFPASLAEDSIRSIRRMKLRAEQEIEKRGLRDREVKRSPGGIRDIEFAVQLLQLVHGRHDQALRVRGTVPALEEMARAGYVGREDAVALEEAYVFLRTVEHRLQMEDDRQVHTLPSAPAARARIARVLGYRDRPDSNALEQFEKVLGRHQAAARTVHERLFYRPLLEALSASTPLPEVMSSEAALDRLVAFGFRRARDSGTALVELTQGLSRTSRLMRQLLPLMLGWLSDAPDPDLGLVQLRHLVEAMGETTALVVAFRDNPVAAQRLCQVIGTSRLVGEVLRRHPEAVLTLTEPDAGGAKPPELLRSEAVQQLKLRDDHEAGLRTFRRREFVRIASRDLLDIDDQPAAELTGLADACLEASLTTVLDGWPAASRPEMAVIAFGRYGGAELSYASDLDVMFVHEGGEPGAAEKVAERMLALVGGITPEGQAFRVDADLRPEGKSGLLSRPLEGYVSYWDKWAQTWERQSLLRARPAAGSPELSALFLEAARLVTRTGLSPEMAREIRHMKARIERERIPSGEDPAFHLKLGRGSLSDVEFTVQLLQLRHGVAEAGVGGAVEALLAAGHLSEEDASALRDSYRYCNRVRDRLFLIKGRPSDSLPTDPLEGQRLAESLGYDRVNEMREVYRRVTRRARAAVDRLFWEEP